MRFLMPLVALLLLGVTLAADTDDSTRQSDWLTVPMEPSSIRVSVKNPHTDECELCWLPSDTKKASNCMKLKARSARTVDTFVGHRFVAKCNDETFDIRILPATFEYEASDSLAKLASQPMPDKVARIVSCEAARCLPRQNPNENFDNVWMDALRTSAARNGYAICHCGAYNSSTVYTLTDLPLERPRTIYSSECNCGAAVRYDFYHPFRFDQEAPRDVEIATDCEKMTKPEEVRLHLIHSTTNHDRLSMKGKMWSSLVQVYGLDRAAFIMPRTYDLRYRDGQDERDLIARTQAELAAGKRSSIYITKNEAAHRQLGIGISTGEDVGLDKDQFGLATDFLPRPFLMEGYKINLRRYVLAVCTGGRLRGYIHADGKNFYPKLPYVEPFASRAWRGDPEATKVMLDRIVTTGYVPMSHYIDKPMTGLEFFATLKERGLDYSTLLKTMHTRMALALHMSITADPWDLCTTDGVPSCLHNSVRSQHFGCDFQIDEELLGYRSRLFECNKGPDMHTHNERDGRMKRAVAQDIYSLLSVGDQFDDSEENCRRHNMTKVYDSETFDPAAAFAFLDSLADRALDVAGIDTETKDEL